MGKRELVALLSLSSWCLVIVVWLFLVVPWVCLQFVIVVFPDHTHLVIFIWSKFDDSMLKLLKETHSLNFNINHIYCKGDLYFLCIYSFGNVIHLCLYR